MHEVLETVDHRITYRQLDHWIRTGRVTLAQGRSPGSGNHRLMSPIEVAALADYIRIHDQIGEVAALLASGEAWTQLVAKHSLHLVEVGT